ncbi:ParM/StbA family protein [Microcoleus sp. FACHB-1515]|uniref:ParM/StbA family protein n=1 Tax=Cyanophyceae TaxID=3028117 RepID=UPI001681D7CD|nr:ParM/StbA family protein [Microcoleus sp. FACHB-1515]MBD2092569.1 ParM/StbA family protein [Microcoleus sp. FACHB-1515]
MTLAYSQSLVRIANEHTENSPLIRPIVCFDGGNRTIQWIDPDGNIRQIPSYLKPIDPTWEEVEPDVNSIVIEFEDQHFAIGQVAKDMGGTPTFQADKIELARRLVLAALEPNPVNQFDALRVERLLIALPNSRGDLSSLKAIEGTYDFVRNGQAIVATVRRVEAIDETRAAFVYGMQQGLFLSRKQVNGVLDLGGGTSIARLYSVGGSLMREADVILPGTFDLARKIASRINRDLPTSADLSLIMDAIERGDYCYGTTGYSFAPAFESARAEWLDEIRGQIKTRWGQWLPNLGEVLIIGGSAPIALPLQDATKGRFKIAPNPQTISIVGMGAL